MSGPREDELRELIDGFCDTSDDAARMVEDFRRGMGILDDNPAPGPDRQLLAEIKHGFAAEIASHRRHVIFRRLEYVAAVAAAVIVVASIVMGPFQQRPSMPNTASIIPTAFWESDDVATADPSLASIRAEIDQIEDEMMILESGDGGRTAGENSVSEIEMELIEIEEEFWKG